MVLTFSTYLEGFSRDLGPSRRSLSVELGPGRILRTDEDIGNSVTNQWPICRKASKPANAFPDAKLDEPAMDHPYSSLAARGEHVSCGIDNLRTTSAPHLPLTYFDINMPSMFLPRTMSDGSWSSPWCEEPDSKSFQPTLSRVESLSGITATATIGDESDLPSDLPHISSPTEGSSSGRENEKDDPESEESLEARIERLGRERPPAFDSIWTEAPFVFSVLMGQILTEYFVSGFNILLPTLIRDLNIPRSSSVWPATAFSLVIASTLLVFGRLGDMWGGYPVYLAGLTWLLVWSVIAGFSINPLMLDFCRALQGLGASAFLPAGVMLMGSIYRPGPRKNLVFGLYGASAVLGFFLGICKSYSFS